MPAKPNTIRGFLPVVPPYDFVISTHSHRNKKHHPDQYDRSKGLYKKALEIDGNVCLAIIKPAGTISVPKLSVSLIGDHADLIALRKAKQIISRQFLTEFDLKLFYKAIRNDSVMAGITKRFYGLKPNWPGDLFQCIASCIISQQINVTFADKVETVMIQRFGRKLESDSGRFFTFPTAARIAELDYKDLEAIQFSRKKAEYLIDLARSIVRGVTDLDQIEKLPADLFTPEITKIRGIGRWTAECCLMHLGHTHIFPIGDVGLHHAVRGFYPPFKGDLQRRLIKLSKGWNGWSSLATYYLWHALMHARANP